MTNKQESETDSYSRLLLKSMGLYFVMCILVLAIIALISSTPSIAGTNDDGSIMILPVVRVIDGDTIKTEFVMLPPELRNVSIRVLGIDTPEKKPRAKCISEHMKAMQATDFVRSLVKDKNQMMKVMNIKPDKFGGRYDGVVYINGVNVGDELIKAGLARPYRGEKKSSWCN